MSGWVTLISPPLNHPLYPLSLPFLSTLWVAAAAGLASGKKTQTRNRESNKQGSICLAAAWHSEG